MSRQRADGWYRPRGPSGPWCFFDRRPGMDSRCVMSLCSRFTVSGFEKAPKLYDETEARFETRCQTCQRLLNESRGSEINETSPAWREAFRRTARRSG